MQVEPKQLSAAMQSVQPLFQVNGVLQLPFRPSSAGVRFACHGLCCLHQEFFQMHQVVFDQATFQISWHHQNVCTAASVFL